MAIVARTRDPSPGSGDCPTKKSAQASMPSTPLSPAGLDDYDSRGGAAAVLARSVPLKSAGLGSMRVAKAAS